MQTDDFDRLISRIQNQNPTLKIRHDATFRKWNRNFCSKIEFCHKEKSARMGESSQKGLLSAS
jgi:hypothetical protein